MLLQSQLLCWSGVQVEGIAVNKVKAWLSKNREDVLKRDTKNISGKVITNTAMKIQRF